jgi:phosphoglycerate dehydrogenase-like enzyme
MKIVIADRNLLAHRDRFEAAIPAGSNTSWHNVFDERGLASDLRDADVYVGSVFTNTMRAAGQSLRLVHAPGVGANTFHHERSIQVRRRERCRTSTPNVGGGQGASEKPVGIC